MCQHTRKTQLANWKPSLFRPPLKFTEAVNCRIIAGVVRNLILIDLFSAATMKMMSRWRWRESAEKLTNEWLSDVIEWTLNRLVNEWLNVSKQALPVSSRTSGTVSNSFHRFPTCRSSFRGWMHKYSHQVQSVQSLQKLSTRCLLKKPINLKKLARVSASAAPPETDLFSDLFS